MKVTDKHVLFWGGWLSNFHKSPVKIENTSFSDIEQFFAWKKAVFFKDFITADKILQTQDNPRAAKKLGRQVRNYDDSKWNEVREEVMYLGTLEKYKQNPDLKKLLLKEEYDGKTFVEASPFDRLWGIGLREEDEDADNEEKWLGKNMLGKIITKVREELK